MINARLSLKAYQILVQTFFFANIFLGVSCVAEALANILSLDIYFEVVSTTELQSKFDRSIHNR